MKCERRRREREAGPSSERFEYETVMLTRLIRKAEEREKGERAQDVKPTTLDAEHDFGKCLPNGARDLNDMLVVIVCVRPAFPLPRMCIHPEGENIR